MSASIIEIRRGRPALVLAPMEGVTDAPMRALFSERGGFNFCVAEFLRVSQEVPPARVYLDHLPELKAARAALREGGGFADVQCLTPSGVPIQLQLLGGDAERMALSALRAYELGVKAVDINFGCPAPTVNRHDGGAAILRDPPRIQKIVRAIRDALPRSIPVSAKLRLGWSSTQDIHVNAEQAAAGGADWITIHARTKMQGYAPPVDWQAIGLVRKNLDIPVVANGDIWTRENFDQCREVTGCEHFMIGRSALADPSLPLWIAGRLGSVSSFPGGSGDSRRFPAFGDDPSEWAPILRRFSVLCSIHNPLEAYAVRRIKQWLKMATVRQPLPWFEQVKRAETLDEVFIALEGGH